MKDELLVERTKAMAKPPAEVRFPGDRNRRKKIRMRGIKQASKEIQGRLDRNLEELVEDPEVFLPEIIGDVDQSFFSKDLMAKTLKEVSTVSAKRHDIRWLRKRMTKKGGDIVCRALAGSLLAASEEDRSTVQEPAIWCRQLHSQRKRKAKSSRGDSKSQPPQAQTLGLG